MSGIVLFFTERGGAIFLLLTSLPKWGWGVAFGLFFLSHRRGLNMHDFRREGTKTEEAFLLYTPLVKSQK